MGTRAHLLVWSEGGRRLTLLSLPRLVPASLLSKSLFFPGVPRPCPRTPVLWADAAGGDPDPTGPWRPCPGRFPVWERPQVGKLRPGRRGRTCPGPVGAQQRWQWGRQAWPALGGFSLLTPYRGPTRDLPAPTGCCSGRSRRRPLSSLAGRGERMQVGGVPRGLG